MWTSSEGMVEALRGRLELASCPLRPLAKFTSCLVAKRVHCMLLNQVSDRPLSSVQDQLDLMT